MSSGLLYVAIVGVWALVLVPMWLRGNETGERSRARLLSRRHAPTPGPHRTPPDGGTPGEAPAEHPDPAEPPRLGREPEAAERGPGRYRGHTSPAPPARPAAVPTGRLSGGRSRARVIARRRRRLFGISLLFLAAVVLAVSRLAPSWVIAPPTVLLLCYLAVLRAAGQIDAERRQSLAAARTDDAPPHRPEPVAEPDDDAEVIPLAPEARRGDEPYDQYTDANLRAVGD